MKLKGGSVLLVNVVSLIEFDVGLMNLEIFMIAKIIVMIDRIIDRVPLTDEHI